MDNPNSYILKTHVTTISSSSYVSTPNGPIFLLPIFPFRWLESEVTCMPQNLLAPCKEVMARSITSMAIFNDSFDDLLLGFIVSTLFVLVGLCVVMFDLA
jgi:hypothetical protein